MSEEFKRWLALYFIKKGNWKLTDKAIEEFGTSETPKQAMEFAENYSSRKRDERIVYRVGLAAKEKKKIAHEKIESMLDAGKAEELLNSGYITYFAKWKDVSDRVTVVKMLIEKLKKDPRDLTKEDFEKNRLWGLICHHYGNSPYEAVNEAYPELNIKPWEMIQTPRGFYEKKENRIAAVKWLVEKLNKDPRDLTVEDFNKNRLRGVLPYYDDSPYEAVKEAGLVTEADEKQMRNRGYFGYRDIPSSKEVLEAAKKMERNARESQPEGKICQKTPHPKVIKLF